MDKQSSYRIAVVKWKRAGGSISEMIARELSALGHRPLCFLHNEKIPEQIDVLFTYAPYGRLNPIIQQLAQLPAAARPLFVHWNTENPPDLRLPWFFMYAMGRLRASLDRLNDKQNRYLRRLVNLPPLSFFNSHFTKFRYVGENHYAYKKKLLHIYAESSQIYARLHNRHGLPTIFIPWGTVPSWYDTLQLRRDIDVLWMGSRRKRRRSILLDQVRQGLAARGVSMYVADNIENPFLYGKKRTEFLNRAKITLNLLPTWDDNAFPYRFHMAAGNRSLVVTEHTLPHYPVVTAGTHYVSARTERLVETILYYLEHGAERHQITEAAYRLVTTKLTFRNSVAQIMTAVTQAKENDKGGSSRSPARTARWHGRDAGHS